MTFTGLLIRGALALIFLVVGWWAARVAEGLAERSLNRLKVDAMLVRFGASATRWGVLALVVISALGAIGIGTLSFAAVLGAAGLAIGFALKDVLASLAAGVLLLVQRPFKVGDFVRAGGETGTVVEVGLFSTLLNTPDNKRIVVQNQRVLGGNIENVSFHPRRRVDVPIGVSYRADIDETREALLGVTRTVAETPGALSDPAPQIVLDGLADSAVTWQVRIWANSADFLAVRQATIRQIKLALDEKGIGIPYPQMDVHLARGAEAPTEAGA